MRIVSAICFITYKEGIKYRILFGILIFALFTILLSVLFSGLFMRDLGKVIVDFCLSSVSIGGLLVPFFLVIKLLAGDLENKTIFTILSGPVSRKHYIFGKFAGITLLTATTMGILLVATFLALSIGKYLYGENYFSSLSAEAVISAVVLNFLGISMLNALVILWCTVTTSSFLATLLALASYLIGHSIDDVVRFIATPPPGIEIATTVKNTVAIVQYIFPNLSLFDLKLYASAGVALSLKESSMLTGYSVAYSAAALSLAVLVFSRRDIS